MKFSLKKMLWLPILATAFLLTSSFAMAQGKTKVVIFCASWNAKCRTAVPAVQSAISAHADAIQLYNFNIDSPSSQDDARELGLSMPRSVPYIAVLDRNNKFITQIMYTNQTPEDLKKQIESYLPPQ